MVCALKSFRGRLNWKLAIGASLREDARDVSSENGFALAVVIVVDAANVVAFLVDHKRKRKRSYMTAATNIYNEKELQPVLDIVEKA